LIDLLQYGFLGIFLFSFALGILPFTGPSNMVIAGAIAAIFPSLDPIGIGVGVALGATTAKTVHYYVAFFASRALSNSRKEMLQRYGNKVQKWAMAAVFVSAATPIPDEPVVVPLGLMRYSFLRFFAAYLAGKLSITISGAYLGERVGSSLENIIGTPLMMGLTAILTVAITVAMVKIDFDKWLARLRQFFSEGNKWPRPGAA
jgi:uncharacterized membrane protein YdjX (TVP38/TMEM64 family)